MVARSGLRKPDDRVLTGRPQAATWANPSETLATDTNVVGVDRGPIGGGVVPAVLAATVGVVLGQATGTRGAVGIGINIYRAAGRGRGDSLLSTSSKDGNMTG